MTSLLAVVPSLVPALVLLSPVVEQDKQIASWPVEVRFAPAMFFGTLLCALVVLEWWRNRER